MKADVPELNQMGAVFFLKTKIECHLANDGASVQDLGQGSMDGSPLAQQALCVSTTANKLDENTFIFTEQKLALLSSICW